MADLEELGYLQQPHASAGRIPSDLGYRYYVDGLMTPASLDEEERWAIQTELSRRTAIEELVHSTAQVVASMTRYASLAVVPRIEDAILKRVELIALDPQVVLVVFVGIPGLVEHRVVETHRSWTQEELARVEAVLNDCLEGVSVRDLGRTLYQQVADVLGDPDLYDGAASLLEDALAAGGDERVYVEGAINLFHQPEFRDVDRLRPLLEFLEQKDALLNILSSHGQSGLTIRIGQENGHGPLEGCSLVMATYEVGGQVVGQIGVLGPTRARVQPGGGRHAPGGRGVEPGPGPAPQPAVNPRGGRRGKVFQEGSCGALFRGAASVRRFSVEGSLWPSRLRNAPG